MAFKRYVEMCRIPSPSGFSPGKPRLNVDDECATIKITAVFSDDFKFGNVMIPFERSSGKFYHQSANR